MWYKAPPKASYIYFCCKTSGWVEPAQEQERGLEPGCAAQGVKGAWAMFALLALSSGDYKRLITLDPLDKGH